MEIFNLWLPLIGGGVFAAIAISAWFAEYKLTGIWFGFAACVCFLLLAALQIQEFEIAKSHVHSESPEVRRTRAYVFIDTIKTSNIDDNLMTVAPDKIASIFVAIKNTGQTPALKFTHQTHISFAAFPPPSGLFDIPRLKPGTVDNLAVGAFATTTVGLGRALSVDEKTILGLGTHAVYLFGQIFYEDVYGIKRCTRYRYRVGGDVGFNGTNMAPMPEGNETDVNCE